MSGMCQIIGDLTGFLSGNNGEKQGKTGEKRVRNCSKTHVNPLCNPVSLSLSLSSGVNSRFHCWVRRWPEGEHHSAQRALPKGNLIGFTLSLSNLLTFILRCAGYSCAQRYTTFNTFGEIYAQRGSHPGEYP